MKFTKSAVADDIIQVSYATFSKYVKENKIFPPHINSEDGKRPYYSLSDVMLISYIYHGSIKMDLVLNILYNSTYINEKDLQKYPNIQEAIKSSFAEVKKILTTKEIPDIELSLQEYINNNE